MSGGRRVAIWNPASGSAVEEDALRNALGDDVELRETSADEPGDGIAARAVAAGAEIVVACGGDGTVRACLAPLARRRASLAVVPLGTGNLLATNLGLGSGLDAAAGIGAGRPRTIDLGRINGEAFAVMAGTGFDALMIRDANPTLKSRLGSIAYVFSAFKHLRTALVPTTIRVDGDRWLEASTSMVLVGNFGTITGGIDVFPDAMPDDGILDVAAVSATTWRQWAAVAWGLLRRKAPPPHLVRRARGRRFTIDHARPRVYELDGENRDPTSHLDVEVDPAALTIHQRPVEQRDRRSQEAAGVQ